MELSKIKKLINSGYLTKVDDMDVLVNMTEDEMINNGYLTHTNMFDGDDATDESTELPEVDDVEAPEVESDDNPVGEIESPTEEEGEL